MLTFSSLNENMCTNCTNTNHSITHNCIRYYSILMWWLTLISVLFTAPNGQTAEMQGKWEVI